MKGLVWLPLSLAVAAATVVTTALTVIVASSVIEVIKEKAKES